MRRNWLGWLFPSWQRVLLNTAAHRGSSQAGDVFDFCRPVHQLEGLSWCFGCDGQRVHPSTSQMYALFFNGSSLSRCFVWASYQMNMWNKSNRKPFDLTCQVIDFLTDTDTMTLYLPTFLITFFHKSKLYHGLFCLIAQEGKRRKNPVLTVPFVCSHLIRPSFWGGLSLGRWVVRIQAACREKEAVSHTLLLFVLE